MHEASIAVITKPKKALAIHLRSVVCTLLHSNQVPCVPRREGVHHVRYMTDVIATTENRYDPLLALSLDAEKAFDRLSWEFLYSAL